MKTFVIIVLFFLAFLIIAPGMLANVDLTSNTTETVQADAVTPTLPVVITILESLPTPTPGIIIVPLTGSCANPYIVRAGDWLLRIASNCGITLSAILQANPQIINPDMIYPNQQIILEYIDI
jgi:LysM repeat protein